MTWNSQQFFQDIGESTQHEKVLLFSPWVVGTHKHTYRTHGKIKTHIQSSMHGKHLSTQFLVPLIFKIDNTLQQFLKREAGPEIHPSSAHCQQNQCLHQLKQHAALPRTTDKFILNSHHNP